MNTKTLTSRNILITGGAGFIGSHLADKLLSLGNRVTVLDNLSSGNMDFLGGAMEEANFSFIEMDLLERKLLEDVVKDFDWVFHLAANPDVRLGASDTYIHLEQNVIATYNLLEACRINGIKNFMFTSTSTVYGEASVIPTPESYGPLIPISLYASSKLSSEGFITAYCSNFGMNAHIFRFANVIGTRSTHGVIYDFIHKLRDNPKELEILGQAPGTRKSYFHVSDCINGIIHACNNSDNMVNIFNIGSRDHITVKTIADAVCEAMALSDVRYIWTGGVDGGRGWKGDVKVMLLSIESMEKIGFTPMFSSKEAVRMSAQEIDGEC